MSLTDVRSYFRTRLDALNLKEWKDAFNFENIPDNIFDNAYHLQTGITTGVQFAHADLQMDSNLIVRVFLKGFRDPASEIDNALVLAENILLSVLSHDDRLTGVLINLNMNTIEIEPFAGSNDNDIMMILDFTARVALNIVN